MNDTLIRRGDIFWVNLDPTVGAEIRKKRPAVVVQNDIGNRFSPLTIIAPITGTKDVLKPLPILVPLKAGDGGLPDDGYVNCGQIRTIDKAKRLGKKIGSLPRSRIEEINKALRISLDL